MNKSDQMPNIAKGHSYNAEVLGTIHVLSRSWKAVSEINVDKKLNTEVEYFDR
jgi:hypothetical protein